MGPEISRRFFIKALGAGLLAGGLGLYFPDLAQTPEHNEKIPEPVFPKFSVGLHNGHVLEKFLGLPIRLPLNRAAFDRDIEKTGRSELLLDPFYKQQEKLSDFRKAGSNIVLIMEIEEKDGESFLGEMLEYAQKIISFRDGDSIVLGNELNLRESYSPQTYLRQADFLQRNIKAIDSKIMIGMAGEGWSRDFAFFEAVLSRLSGFDFAFDFLPLHCYGLPSDIAATALLHREILDKHGFKDMAISIGESGAADSTYADNPAGFLQTKPENQPDAIIKALCFTKLSGCFSFSLYAATDTFNGSFMERFGLVDHNFQARPAFYAFEDIQKLFNRPGSLSYCFANERHIFTLRHAKGAAELSWQNSYTDPLGEPVQRRLLTDL